MNSTSIIIGIGFLVLFIVPLAYLTTAGSRKKKKLIAGLSALASENSCKISDMDQWKKSCIGIDMENKKIFYLSKNEKLVVDLKNVAKCNLNNPNNSKKDKNSKIELEFTLKSPSDKILKIEFFDTVIDTYIVDEDMQIPYKWHNTINSLINSNVKAMELS
jgi:hypothetical protein